VKSVLKLKWADCYCNDEYSFINQKEIRRVPYRVMVETPERGHLEDLGLDRRIIFKWLLNKKSLSRG
jgi:hypothetical protein